METFQNIVAPEATPVRIRHLNWAIVFIIFWNASILSFSEMPDGWILFMLGALFLLPLFYAVSLPSAYAMLFWLRRCGVRDSAVWVLSALLANPFVTIPLLSIVNHRGSDDAARLKMLILLGAYAFGSATVGLILHACWKDTPYPVKGAGETGIFQWLLVIIGTLTIMFAPVAYWSNAA